MNPSAPSNPTALSAEAVLDSLKRFSEAQRTYARLQQYGVLQDALNSQADMADQAAALILTLSEDRKIVEWMERHALDYDRFIGTDSDGWCYAMHESAMMESSFRTAVKNAMNRTAAATPPTKAASGS